MARYYDFDAAAEESEPITVRVLGQDWTLPPTVPAAPLLAYERMLLDLEEHELVQEQLPPEQRTPFRISDDFSVETVVRQCAGDDTVVDEWLAKGLDYPGLQRIARRLRAIRTGRDGGLGGTPAPRPDAGGQGRPVTVGDVLAHWAPLEADFDQHHHVPDLLDELRNRTWRWFTVRLRGLPHDSRFARALRAAPDPVHTPGVVVSSLPAAEAAMRRWAGV